MYEFIVTLSVQKYGNDGPQQLKSVDTNSVANNVSSMDTSFLSVHGLNRKIQDTVLRHDNFNEKELKECSWLTKIFKQGP